MNYIYIFDFQIPMYGLMLIIGLVVTNSLAIWINKKLNFDLNDFIILEAYGLAFGMLGAKLLYLWVSRALIDWSRFFERDYFNAYMTGGFVFYGGLIGGIVGIIIAKVAHKIDVMKYISAIIFALPMLHGFGRIGCHFAGCCYGVPYNGLFHIRYSHIEYTLCEVDLFPVQLLEAIILFIIAIVLLYLTISKGPSKKYILYYLVFYCVARFFLECLRYDSSRGGVWIFSTSQLISIIIFIVVLVYCFIKKKKKSF